MADMTQARRAPRRRRQRDRSGLHLHSHPRPGPDRRARHLPGAGAPEPLDRQRPVGQLAHRAERAARPERHRAHDRGGHGAGARGSGSAPRRGPGVLRADRPGAQGAPAGRDAPEAAPLAEVQALVERGNGRLMAIMSALAFQDLTAQKIQRAFEVLEEVNIRLGKIHHLVSFGAEEPPAVRGRRTSRNRPTDSPGRIWPTRSCGASRRSERALAASPGPYARHHRHRRRHGERCLGSASRAGRCSSCPARRVPDHRGLGRREPAHRHLPSVLRQLMRQFLGAMRASAFNPRRCTSICSSFSTSCSARRRRAG